jgi:ureidoacrylate peracid hydrolase
MAFPNTGEKSLRIEARPEAVRVDPARTALIVVDMQNAFASKGGMFDLVGQDVSGAREVITTIKKLTEAARAAHVRIIYLTMSYAADMSDSGGPGSPNWYKEFGLAAMNSNPEYKGKFLIRGSWDAEVVDELRPQPGDVVIQKSRYSGFRGTSLDVVLKTFGITYLIFTGIATNVCVESTVRDAFFLDYWPILVSDAANNVGPAFTQQATLWNVEALFGWVATSEDILTALSGRVEARPTW